MIFNHDNKIVVATEPGALVNNGNVPTVGVDTKGYDYADAYLILGATDIAFTALKLQQSDDGATYTDVPNGDYTLAVGEPLPTAVSDNGIFAFHVNLLGKKRYLKVIATVGNGTAGAYVTIVFVLGRPRESPNSAAKRGVVEELFV